MLTRPTRLLQDEHRQFFLRWRDAHIIGAVVDEIPPLVALHGMYAEDIADHFQDGLRRSARAYLRIGLDLFHTNPADSARVQAALGNLAVGIELLLKAFVARTRIDLLFTDLEPAARIALTVPSAIPRGFPWQKHRLELWSGKTKTIDLSDAIACFEALLPEVAQRLGAHLRFLASIRNRCLHSVFPVHERFHLNRVAYLAVQLATHFTEWLNVSSYCEAQLITADDLDFARRFDSERIGRVTKAIEKAHSRAQKLSYQSESADIDDWDHYPIPCPVCRNEGAVSGKSELRNDDYADPHPYLVMLAESYACQHCGLQLNDPEELRLADIETEVFRNDADEYYRATDPLGDFEP